MRTGIQKNMTEPRAQRNGARVFQPVLRKGFSLLELLVALAVLMLIVLVVSIVFQQTSTMWQGTSAQNGLDMVVRGIVTRIRSDMAQAVPASNFITRDNTSIGTINDRVTHSLGSAGGSSDVWFIMLRETAGGAREARAVRYKFAASKVMREEVPLEFDRENGWRTINWTHPDKNSHDMGGQVGNARIQSLVFKTPPPPVGFRSSYDLPAYVDIEVKVEYDDETYSAFAARSLGPDKMLDTKDDIYVGGKE